jgi:DNA-binding SARP family transcriptional activator/tetratricopeptide (TPR) repeat protein
VTVAPPDIRILGELEVVRGGKPLPLPASKKTRALLGYLVVTGARPQPRQRLCELLWDGPDDPRAALRWSLTKIRPLVDDARATRIVADREHVAFEACGATTDLASVRESLGSLADASLDTLRRAAARFRGELLEGLDLPECYRYHEWCIAARAAARRLRGHILATLAERLVDDPEEALGFARARVTIDPLAEAGHIAVMQLLAKLGRPRDALKQYESCRRVLEGQLGRGPSKELQAARSILGGFAPEATVNVAGARLTPVHAAAPPSATPLIGRTEERAILVKAVREASEGASHRVLLLVGEPGIGKTRLLGEVADQARALGGEPLAGRAFEAEMVRPYGPWIDLLRSASPGEIEDSLRSGLTPLLPELGSAPGETDRNRLFDAVGKLLRARASRGPLVVILDDLQWFDEASVALLHYVTRTLAGSRVLVACGARAAEIDGNLPVQAFARALLREGRLTRVDLSPLDAAATMELVRAVDVRIDGAQIFVDGGGNPLFSLELARALAQGDRDAATPSLDGLIAERLSRLGEHAADLLPWAAALGHAFTIDTLATLTSLPVQDLLGAVEELESHRVLRVASAARGVVGYDFAHDLVRRTAYRSMSEPRRRWVHLQIARALSATGDPQGALAGDIAHHAAIGGDSELAARAYVTAGERSLRLFAHADASKLAASGLAHADRLSPEMATRMRLALLDVQVHSKQWRRRSHELEAELSRVAVAAQQRAMHAEVSRSFYLMSFIHNERGDFAGASARSLQAVQAGRSADIETTQGQLANTGRCLVLVERDVAHAEEFLREAQALGPHMTGRTQFEVSLGLGLLHAFKGEYEKAVPRLGRAAELAAGDADHWGHSLALIRLARLSLDLAQPREVIARCLALEPLVAKLSEGSEGPFVATLLALARVQLGESGALAAVTAALAKLRAVDSKAQLAYALDVLAEQDVGTGRRDPARRCAEEALGAAEAVGQKSEAAVARSLLAQLAFDQGDGDAARALLLASATDMTTPLVLSARARSAVARAAAHIGARFD